jgi:hypothetical protein
MGFFFYERYLFNPSCCIYYHEDIRKDMFEDGGYFLILRR